MTSEAKRSFDTPCKPETQSLPPLRQGDWVCLSCNNLNFSFRTVCNRCKTQTRETNNFYGYMVRSAVCYEIAEAKNPEILDGGKGSDKENQEIMDDRHWPTDQKSKQPKSAKVFQNALLLTPTKDQPNMNTDQPYKSPFRLPSVSPLLKKFSESNALQRYSTAQNPKFCNRSHVKVIDFNYHEVVEDENDGIDQEIDRLLESIEL